MLPYFRGATEENSKKYIVQFRGLNLGEGYQDGDFSDCMNISSALFPCISTRWGRSEEGSYAAPEALHSKGEMLVIDGETVYYGGKAVGNVNTERKQIATVGKYIVIFPDKVYYDTEAEVFGSMNISATAAAGKAVFSHNTVTVSGTSWDFKEGDAVEISGCTTYPENNKTIIIRGVEGDTLTFYENSFTAGTEESAVSFKREVPDLDFICESNYRLWGVKGNTIYGSKYSDPFNFNVFDGLTGDSYFIDVGSDGDWTGCIPYSSHICFFKEHTLHKLYGSKPSNFQIVTSQVYGVQKGSERSMVIINETLLYKGVNGVYAYTGGVPELISESFGTVRYADACAASDGERYYVSMRHNDAWSLLVYDVLRDMWVAEDHMHCVDMAFFDGHIYFLSDEGKLWKVDEGLSKEDIEWSVTFKPFNEVINERKGYSKFHLRLELDSGAWLKVEVKRDNDTRWTKVYTTHNSRKRTLSIPILPARCDSIEVRLSGKGDCLVRTFVREFFVGSDV